MAISCCFLPLLCFVIYVSLYYPIYLYKFIPYVTAMVKYLCKEINNKIRYFRHIDNLGKKYIKKIIGTAK